MYNTYYIMSDITKKRPKRRPNFKELDQITVDMKIKFNLMCNIYML